MRSSRELRSPVSLVGVGLVVAVLAAFGLPFWHPNTAVHGGIRVTKGSSEPGQYPHRLTTAEVPAAVERTVAAESARLDATYSPANGPMVTITGHTSFAGPESEVSAAVGGDAPALVRVTADGAWLRPPGSVEWSPVSREQVSGAAAARGWSDLLRTLRSSDDVWVDTDGRIVRVRRASLDVRFSDFGTNVVLVPP